MLKFNSIENNGIFTKDFNPLVKNNEIDFPTGEEEIVAIYGPNGAGKTSLIKVLSGAKGTKVNFIHEGTSYTNGSSVFHLIQDQNNRNIIAGETKDFILGENIAREIELQRVIANAHGSIVTEIATKLKANYSISAMTSQILDLLSDSEAKAMVKDIVNNKSRGANYETKHFITKFTEIPLVHQDISEEQQAKLIFLKTDIQAKESIILYVERLTSKEVASNPEIKEVEENSEAIRVLELFHKNQCIVCDSEGIDWATLLSSKTKNRMRIIETLDKDMRSLITKINELRPDKDPFNIKSILIEAVRCGDKRGIIGLMADFAFIKKMLERQVMNELATVFVDSDLPSQMDEYQELLKAKPVITEEDMLFIEEIISNSMRKDLSLERDGKGNLRITLSKCEFLGKSRDELPLSAGEQNFLSLTFEFLKAKNSPCPIVVIDDPISSFDSIYKNKVVYAIVKMLHCKKRIILTHNIDLLRLLEGQHKRCYRLYLLNNTDGEENGFISLNNKEHEMLISIEKLLDAFRGGILEHIKNANLFLISLIPFMRGYANILGNTQVTDSLTKVMHGYESQKVDVGGAFTALFGRHAGNIPESYEVSVPDILSTIVDGKSILDPTKYPLLERTLHHSFTYLFLRLLVEKRLVSKFDIDVSQYRQLGQIINKAFSNKNDIDQTKNRIRLTSKKTLINDFNHFEGNLSIFQPAIDITDQALAKEKSDIMDIVSNL